jgi:hypothetical protein
MNFALSGFKDNIDLNRIFELSNSIMEKVNSGQIKDMSVYLSSKWQDNRKYKVGYNNKQDVVIIFRED